MTTISIKPLSGAIGAVISGVDLGKNLSAAVIAEIRQALLDYCGICFRDLASAASRAAKRVAKRMRRTTRAPVSLLSPKQPFLLQQRMM